MKIGKIKLKNYIAPDNSQSMDVQLVALSVAFMLLYVYTRKRIAGSTAWSIFALACFLKVLDYVAGGDYYNTAVFSLAFIFFLTLSFAIFRLNSATFVEVTAFSALACIIYFPFAFNAYLKSWLIGVTAELTVKLGNSLGYPMSLKESTISLNGRNVEIILACTAIESISLFSGATLGIKAELKRKVAALLVSVPTIYVLNLFRNVFVTASFAYSWFGENSFYIAHHIIAKILSTLALIMIAYTVFRILPELADLIYSLKNEMIRSVRA